jgi:hypothetical protein
MQDVEAIDILDARDADRPRDRTLADQRRKRLALLFRQFLGVVQSGDRSCRIKDDRCGIDRTAQRAAPGFVDTRDHVDACGR